MTRFDHVKEILDAAVGGKNIHAHGPFWRGLSRDAFVAKVVFGEQLLVVGDAANSNLSKALRGLPPFDGSDYPRMPAGMAPVPELDIQFIEQWINEGCLEDGFQPPPGGGPPVPLFAGAPVGPIHTPELDVAFWREFDNRTLYQPTPQVAQAIQAVMGRTVVWRRLAKGTATEAQWQAQVQAMNAELDIISALHMSVVSNFYGAPLHQAALFMSFQQFGANALPADPLRPDDPEHTMNGNSMWFVWSAVADACLRLNIDTAFWEILCRAVMIGSANDGLMRGRFQVVGFTPDPVGQAAVLAYFSALPANALRMELTRRYRDSGL